MFLQVGVCLKYPFYYSKLGIFLSWFEDEFDKNCSKLDVEIKCSNGHKFTETIFYEGVVAVEERNMGKEITHTWKNEEIVCPECGEELTVQLDFWEYPEGWVNHASFDMSDCKVLNQNEVFEKIGIKME